MCGKQPKIVQQKTVQRDPVAEQAEAERKAQLAENENLAAQRRRRQRSSLLTAGAKGSVAMPQTASLLARPNTAGG